MTKLLLGGAAAAAIVAIAPATAQPTPPAAPQVHTMHIERDRAHTRTEVVTHVRDMFARFDTNRDGYLTKPEAQAGHQAMAGDKRAKFARRLAERGAARPDRGAMFDRLDRNRDGAISRQEFMSAQPQIHERRKIVMRHGPDGAGRPHQMRMHGMKMGGRLFETADANRDGRVTLQEATNAALQRFDTADANRDGTLTREERMQMRQQRKAQRQPA
jgi:Ca2+-binding EF-hand superfamily protein